MKRPAFCRNGHDLEVEGVQIYAKSGAKNGRYCKACRRISDADRKPAAVKFGTCSVCAEPDRKLKAGRCQPCYRRSLRLKRGETVRDSPQITFAEKFKAGYVVDQSGCWIWTISLDGDGYGLLALRGRRHRAHRWSYEHYIGPIPKGLVIDHRCRNRSCVNPRHLEAVTIAENTARGITPSAVTHATGFCPRGHQMTAENKYVRPDGDGSMCRTCQRARRRVYRERTGK